MSDQSLYNPMNDPTIPPFAQNLTWRQIQQRVDAREYWKMKMKANPGNSRYYHHVAPLYGEVKDTRNEIKHHRMATEYNPGDSNALNDFALALYRQGKYDQAEVSPIKLIH